MLEALREMAGLKMNWPVEISGPDMVLPSSFAVNAGSTALVAATASAAAEIGTVRSGNKPATVRVDTTAAALAFQSERHLQQTGSPALWDGLSGHYRTADGYVQFHTNFDHHRAALLDALDLASNSDRAAVEAICTEHASAYLEQVVTESGGIAAALRSFDEWAEHPHAQASRPTMPLTITSLGGNTLGDGVPQALGMCSEDRPLSGLRVLDLTRIVAGPVAGRNLAAYGASVMRVGAAELPVVESVLSDMTLGKTFCHLDLRGTVGRDRLFELVATADVVLTGFRPGALDSLGVGHDALLNANPDLVIGEINAFGRTGPWGGRRGFDSITQTATGIVHAETKASGAATPRPLPCQFLDHGSGYLLSLGVLSALLRRDQIGGPQLVEVTLLGTRNWLVEQGRVDHLDAPALSPESIDAHLRYRETAFGPIQHVVHPGCIDGVDNSFERGPSLPGADPAEW
jgi:crotonobetainyl-CoA:carnitine CoA-transferase CaiB-like acyl-CoA transferase